MSEYVGQFIGSPSAFSHHSPQDEDERQIDWLTGAAIPAISPFGGDLVVAASTVTLVDARWETGDSL